VSCSGFQWVAVGSSGLRLEYVLEYFVLQCVAVCCSVLQCVAVCCSVLRLEDVLEYETCTGLFCATGSQTHTHTHWSQRSTKLLEKGQHTRTHTHTVRLEYVYTLVCTHCRCSRICVHIFYVYTYYYTRVYTSIVHIYTHMFTHIADALEYVYTYSMFLQPIAFGLSFLHSQISIDDLVL